MMALSCKDGKGAILDNGKYVRYTPEQVEALERLYHECPKPSSIRRQQLIRECPILSNIEPKQIKVWFQNRREKQRKEASRLQSVNRKLTAMNKLLMEENDRLQKQVSHLVYENGCFRQHTQNATLATKDTSCESVVTSGQHHLTPQHPPRDASPAGGNFNRPGPDSIGIVAISHGCTGVAARACGLVGLEPTRVAEILKDRPTWFRECRTVDVLDVLPTANGGTIELLYMQVRNIRSHLAIILYAPTTLATARDFWLLRYTSVTEDGSLVVCERSLSNTQNGPSIPPVPNFVRAEMLPSGYLIRPCEGGGSIIHIVDHMNLEALRQLRQIAQEVSQSSTPNWGRRPAALRALSQRLSRYPNHIILIGFKGLRCAYFDISFLGRGFNEAVNGFTDEGWSLMGTDGMDDVTILVNSSPEKLMGLNLSFSNGYPSVNTSVMCAKASMLLQVSHENRHLCGNPYNVPPALLLRFLREHRSEWADNNVDAYSAAAIKLGPCSLPGSRAGNFGGQIILPLAHTIEHEELLEVIKLEGVSHCPEDALMARDMFLLQLCSGMDENAVGMCSELVFAPIDASFADDAPLLPSGFRIIPLDFCKVRSSLNEASSPSRTLDLASALEVRGPGNKTSGDRSVSSGNARSVMTIAFEFAFESHMQESVAAMARQYVHSIISSVQRVASALSPSHLNPNGGIQAPLGTPEAHTLARWISHSYRCYLGVELLKVPGEGSESILKSLWHQSDAILCCSLKVRRFFLPVFRETTALLFGLLTSLPTPFMLLNHYGSMQALPVFTFSNQAGLDMLETTLVALQDIGLEKILDEHGRKSLCSEFPQIMQQGFACLQGGICVSSMGRPVSYERAVAWKVLNEEDNAHCICFMFVNWSFV
ncbi:Homeodomain-containing protein [Cynara cardunculus var. scolymus]|uniref:Homeodomain-containing protein n=1 Tax=Cynara cardunculus var. scolymus TaxID=59895 RepID=A0A118JUS6_CYNCS|nr:Homeodomain-containing protein [Cynara cardunculus var. scolymus]